jgi:hypothetical protein
MAAYNAANRMSGERNVESQNSRLFQLASQDTELSYFRSLDIMEKYTYKAPN